MEARLTPRRVLACAAVLVALVAVTSGCGGGSAAQAAAKDPQPQTYSDRFVRFTYPPVWTAYPPTGPSEMHFQPLVYLSTQSVGNACSVHGNTTSCDWPVKQLQPGGVLALWQLPYLPGGLHGTPQGTRISVGGRPAWRTESAGGECRRIGADRTIVVWIPASGIDLTVCLRRPHLAQNERRVAALLSSTQFHSS